MQRIYTMKNPEILYTSDELNTDFQNQREKIQVVCVGDSLTGWNNFWSGEIFPRTGPYATYPEFLFKYTKLKIADCGIAGALSSTAQKNVRCYLSLFPNAKHFIIGFGTNDLGSSLDLEETSGSIIKNLDNARQDVLDNERQCIFFNVPYVNSRYFSKKSYEKIKNQRNFHNSKLDAYCRQKNAQLADICSILKDEHFADNIHTNEAGARLIALEIKRLISKNRCATHD